jgi:kumamolisin
MSEAIKRVVVPGSEKAPLPGGKILGDAPDDDVLDVTVRVRRRAELPSLAEAAARGGRLTKQQYAEQYGADPEDLAKVERFAQQYGLKVELASSERRSVILSGRVGDFERAFGVRLQSCEVGDERYRTRSGSITMPEELRDVVIGVFGLDDRPYARPHFRACPAPAKPAHATADEAEPHAGAGGFPTGFSPTQIARFYNFPTDVDGTGQTIGIIELGGGFRQEELTTYFQSIGVTPPQVEVASFAGGGDNLPGTDPLDPANPDIEVMLDIQVAGGVAPGAKIVVYFAPDAQGQSFLDVMTAAVHDPDHDLSVISISWGGPESPSPNNQFQVNFNQILEAAAHLQTTVCVASGDNGSADFPLDDPERPWDGQAHVDFPASSPLVLACGGTRMLVASGTLQNEVVWHPGPNEGTGGGVSRTFPLPNFQEQAGVPNATNPAGPIRRGVPDVAGDAAQESGYQVLCDNQRFPDPHHQPPLPPIGGTSAVAPLWAGLIALINQKLGRRVGFVNPALYAIPAQTGAFRDITQGNNGDYAAKAGWDPCTGLGVPDGKKLAAALPAHLPPP